MLEDLPSDFSRVLEVWSPRGGKRITWRITADPAGRYRKLRFVNYPLTKRAFGDCPPAFDFSLSRRSFLSPRDSVAHPVRTLSPLGGAGTVSLNDFTLTIVRPRPWQARGMADVKELSLSLLWCVAWAWLGAACHGQLSKGVRGEFR